MSNIEAGPGGTVIGRLRRAAGRLRRNCSNRYNRFHILSERVQWLEAGAQYDRRRLDYALGVLDGVLPMYEELRALRDTAEFQQAFLEPEPLVTVCVATSQRAKLLTERCLPSIIGQTYRKLQIVVVGDHCTDDTAERIATLRDARIEFHNLPERGPYPPPGPDRWCVAGTSAVNAALAMARGQFVTHLDDDDRYDSERISILLGEAQRHRAEFCWHPILTEFPDGSWRRRGDGRFEYGQVTTGSVFYHRYFTCIPWNVYAYRIGEPGDWNRFRKIKLLRPVLRFVDNPLLHHYKEHNQAPFVAQEDECFLI